MFVVITVLNVGKQGQRIFVWCDISLLTKKSRCSLPGTPFEDTKNGTAMRRMPARKRMTLREMETVR